MRIAIVHDYLNQMGGAEKVVEVFHSMYPSAPIHTSVYIPESVSDTFKTAEIKTSFMQKLPLVRKFARHYLATYPYAFEMFDFSDYDVVLSSSSAFAKGIITGPDTCHICYCHSPMRFAWQYFSYVKREKFNSLARLVLPYVVHRIRKWDEIAANRVDHYLANSREVERRIRKYYRRNATVICPPVETHRFKVSEQDDGYFVIMSRLLAYKRVDVAIETANKLKVPLKIIGSGRDEQRLKSLAGSTVEFLGRLSDNEVVDCLGRSRALIFPGLEDFGIVPLEAMACGKPVIAYGRGGALDSVLDGVTGMFFGEQTVESLAKAIESFDPTDYNPHRIREHAETFDVEVFKQKMDSYIRTKLAQHKEQYGVHSPTDYSEGLAPAGLEAQIEV